MTDTSWEHVPKCPPSSKDTSVSLRCPPSTLRNLGRVAGKGIEIMALPCPQPGGLPTGRALQPGEEVGKGPAAPAGPICGSQAIAENQWGVYFPFSALRFILEQPAQLHSPSENSKGRTSGRDLSRLGSSSQSHHKARERQLESPLAFGPSAHAEEQPQGRENN